LLSSVYIQLKELVKKIHSSEMESTAKRNPGSEMEPEAKGKVTTIQMTRKEISTCQITQALGSCSTLF
jgi:hypothetical protein